MIYLFNLSHIRKSFHLSVFELSCHRPTCLSHTAEASHCPFNCWTSSREDVNSNFYSLWFDPTGNRTQVYRFSSRSSTHSTTDRLFKFVFWRHKINYKRRKKNRWNIVGKAAFTERSCAGVTAKGLWGKDGSTVRYVGTVRYASIFAKKYCSLVRYVFFVMVRVRYVGKVRLFCNGTGTVHW